MNSNEIIERYLAVNNVTHINQSEVKEENTQLLAAVTPDRIMFWGIVGFIICWTAIFFMLSKRVRYSRKKIAVDDISLHQIPCKKCKFYSNDPHLKCAVNPSIVLKEQAVDCSDYCAKENKLS
jgi:hypothetical protein